VVAVLAVLVVDYVYCLEIVTGFGARDHGPMHVAYAFVLAFLGAERPSTKRHLLAALALGSWPTHRHAVASPSEVLGLARGIFGARAFFETAFSCAHDPLEVHRRGHHSPYRGAHGDRRQCRQWQPEWKGRPGHCSHSPAQRSSGHRETGHVNPTAKTIQIFLPGGDPRGIRVAEVTTRIVQTIEVPRSLLQDFLKMPESTQVGVYFLFGEAEDGGDPKVYIGQTGELRKRLASHNKKKDFWERAIVLISRTNSLTQTHALFLEWYCLQQAEKAGRYASKNGNGGTRPHTPAPLEADCLEIFETGSTLLATLGFPVFAPVGAAAPSARDEDVLYCTVTGIKGRGLYTPEGFVVLKGSVGRRDNVPTFSEANQRFRQRLIDGGVVKVKGDTIVFQKDHAFGSPSMAAIALLGRTSNGWREWKSKDGVTLDEMKRSVPGENE
jgi:hypothetical protein